MQSYFRTLSLITVGSMFSGSAMAVPVAAPAPEIGDGMTGAIVGMIVLLAVVLYPRLKRSR